MDPSLQARILGCKNLPTLSAVGLQILELCRAEDTDLALIAQAVSRDPALAARLLRAANSAALGVRGRVTTVQRAVALLGTGATLAIVLTFSLVRSYWRQAEGFDHRAFWRRAILSGVAGRALGAAGAFAPEELFLCSMLQDIGILALREVLPAQYGAILRSAGTDHGRLAALEREALGADHAEVSWLLLQHWCLPEMFEQGALFSHDLGRAQGENPRLRRLLECVFLSGPLADAWSGGVDPSIARAALAAAREAVGASVETVAAALGAMAAAVPEVASELELDLELCDPARLEAMLDEARALHGAHAAPVALVAPEAASWALPQGAEPAARGSGSGIGIGDRALARRAVAAAFELARASGQPLTVALCAVDGGEARDAPALARLLGGCLRQTDFLAAGDSAVVAVLPGTPTRGGLVVAQRMRRRAAAENHCMSFGLATDEPGAAFARVEDLLAAAERALAAAREGGIGRVAFLGAAAAEPVVQAD
jgi:HD-like signal output (HDOD) protein